MVTPKLISKASSHFQVLSLTLEDCACVPQLWDEEVKSGHLLVVGGFYKEGIIIEYDQRLSRVLLCLVHHPMPRA